MSTPKTLVIGATGFLGRHFLEAYRKVHSDTIGTDRTTLDLRNPNIESLDLAGYGYALIGVGISKIADCELNKEKSYLSNVTGTLKLIQELRKHNIIPILFSTDYVYNGIVGNYDEESPFHPLNEYGRQKAVLQKQLLEICGNDFLLIRPSKVFGSTQGDQTLLDEMATKLTRGECVRAAYDQIFCPIFIRDLVRGVIALQERDLRGTFHICGEICSRLELAESVAKKLGASPKLVKAISLDDLNEPFKRPKNTSLNCKKFQQTTSIVCTSVKAYIEQPDFYDTTSHG